ncbi:Gfo/Idh/MocA family protein [Algoriphagus hitonicola]|uniref:Predicted dehydrogenase n=1 Tax=Algoriphagus hitonicola TaxID=435880 RepID=A0A1I2UZ18_9BACT|nr:Gfo/Idh/MocA family oxidoreductase [Algoriphagus hitonicola]SFG81067.1 Predicted dehydrogenase [Algoriphagus hitonicola]
MKTRRSFLQKASISALALSLPTIPMISYSKTQSDPLFNQDEKPLRVAIMGLGSYGTRVAQAMKDCKRAKLVGLVSGTPSKIESWKKEHNIEDKNCYNYENFDQIKDNPDIDAVYVITPNGLHKEHSIRAAKAGKHVICEKPMATTVADAAEMISVCDQMGVKLLIGYRMHFEANTLEVVRKRRAGEFGEIKFFQGLSGFIIGDPTQWRLDPVLSGGGAMMDIGIYSINGARYMIGSEPLWVTAQEVKTDPVKFKEGIDETIIFQMGFPNEVVASCLSTYSMNYLDKFYLNGTKGFAEMQPSTGYGPIEGRTHESPLDNPHVTHQTTQMDQMAAMILDGKEAEIPVDGREGLKDMRIIEAIFEAAKTGEKVALV